MGSGEAIEHLIGKLDFDPAALRHKYDVERDRRIRPDTSAQFIEIAGEYADFSKDPYVDESELAREPLSEDLDFAVIGGGFGGLLAAVQLKKAGFEDIRVIEKGGDFGGTWYWNRYPGLMCDVESYCYLPMLEELEYIPRHKYSYGPEIFEHCRNIARRFGLYEKACLGTGVTGLEWNESAGRWTLTTDRGDVLRPRYVVMASGPMNRPKLPGIPGITEFRGKAFHTSRWDYEYTGGDANGRLERLADKRVGLIGTGATAVQCVPHLGASARHLYVFQRTPSSIDVRNNHPTDEAWAKSLTPGWQEARMNNFTTLVSGGYAERDLVGDGWTEIFRTLTSYAGAGASEKLGRPLNRNEMEKLTEIADYRKMNGIRDRVDSIVRDPDKAEALKPWYRQFCKRPCFHDEYLETFNRPNVTLVDVSDNGIERVVENGLIVRGELIELDCIVYATGFENGTAYTRRSGYEVVGREGRKLSEAWAEGPRTFHGFYSHGFPNCFFIGFNQSAITVNIPHAYLEQSRHLAYVLSETRKAGKSTVHVTREAQEAYGEEARRLARRGVKFYAECTPGYYNGEGTKGVTYLSSTHGSSALEFFEMLRQWRQRGELQGLELS